MLLGNEKLDRAGLVGKAEASFTPGFEAPQVMLPPQPQQQQQQQVSPNMQQDMSPHMAHSPHNLGFPMEPQQSCGMQAMQMQGYVPYGNVPLAYMVTPHGMQPFPANFPMPMAYMPNDHRSGYSQPPAQRPGDSKKTKRRPRKKVEPVVPPRGAKVFVGGLGPASTSQTLRDYFGKFGEILDCSVLADSATKRSRGFGFVEFAGSIPQGVIGTDHIIGERRCGVREYHYNPTV